MLRLLRKRMMAFLTVCIVLLSVCLSAWSQDRVSVEGSVIDLQTGRPIPGVQVSGEETPVLTDAAGRFVLQAIPKGTPILAFARSGYVRTTIWAFKTQNLVVGMTRAGSVSGRLTNERGEPLEGTQVRLVRRVFDEHGTEVLHDGFTALTNDLGEYRLYWVTPGTYYITAQLDESQAPENSNAPVRGRYITSFYPGVVDTANAARLTVPAGADLNGINWSLRSSPKVSGLSISGRVIDSRTGRGGGSSVSLTRLTPFGASVNEVSADGDDGLFSFKDIEPGTYWLRAVSREVMPGASGQSFAQIEIAISDRNIDGITLTMTPGVTITGRLTLEGPFKSASIETLGILLKSIVGPTTLPPSSPQKLQSDGSFTIDSLVPGPYRLEVTSLPPEYFIREVRMGPTDYLGQPVVINEAATAPLQIAVSSNSGEVDGVVLNMRRQPIPGIEAVLIPDRQRDRKEMYLKARTDTEGRFLLQGIPPGNYKLFAWENLEQFGYFDPAVVQQADTQATPVRVTESSTQSIEVRSIP